MSESNKWRSIEEDGYPPDNVKVMTCIVRNGTISNEQCLTRHSNLWWTGGMYVYYNPTHWKFC